MQIFRLWQIIIVLLLLIGCSQSAETPLSSLPSTAKPITSGEAAVGQFSAELTILEQLDFPQARINRIDTNALTQTPFFDVPANGWINQITQQPSSGRILLAYTPPDDSGDQRLDRSGLYWLDGDSQALSPLLIPPSANFYYYTPTFTPDGNQLFYVETTFGGTGADGLLVTLWRYDLQTEERLAIAEDGIWPRVSPDGEWLTYIGVNPNTLERSLVVSRTDGTATQTLIPEGKYFDLDTPLFSADSQHIYFTIAEEAPSTRRWFDVVMGVHTAEAHANHNVPSAWWRIPITGGGEKQLTESGDIILFGVFDATGETLFYSTVTGLYALTIETSVVVTIQETTAFRTLSAE